MRKQKFLAICIGLMALVLTPLTSFAQGAGDIVLNAGWLHLAPIDYSDALTVNARGQSQSIPNTGATVLHSDTGGVTLTYYFTDNVAVEGVMGYPPKMDLDGTGKLSALGRLGSANEWSPTVIFKYVFGHPDAKIRPYLGMGASYVWYSDLKLQQGLASGSFLASPTTGTLSTGPTSAKLSNSFAPVFNAGVSYNLTKHWSVNASVSYLLINTRADLTTQSALGTIKSETRVHVNPIVTFLSVGYKF